MRFVNTSVLVVVGGVCVDVVRDDVGKVGVTLPANLRYAHFFHFYKPSSESVASGLAVVGVRFIVVVLVVTRGPSLRVGGGVLFDIKIALVVPLDRGVVAEPVGVAPSGVVVLEDDVVLDESVVLDGLLDLDGVVLSDAVDVDDSVVSNDVLAVVLSGVSVVKLNDLVVLGPFVVLEVNSAVVLEDVLVVGILVLVVLGVMVLVKKVVLGVDGVVVPPLGVGPPVEGLVTFVISGLLFVSGFVGLVVPGEV